MPLAQKILLSMPIFPLAVIVILISAILSIAGLLTVNRFISRQRLKLHNDVAGFIFAALGTTYAVLIAFILVIVWQEFDKTTGYAEQEANCVVDLYKDCEVFPEPLKSEIRANLKDYVKVVIDEEWGMIGKGQVCTHAWDIVNNLWTLYCGYNPGTAREQIYLKESLNKLNNFLELRRLRYLESRASLHPFLWFVLIFGGMIMVVFTFFFGTENLKAHIVMAAILSIIISLILLAILAFDYPFTGGVTVSTDSFKQMFFFK